MSLSFVDWGVVSVLRDGVASIGHEVRAPKTAELIADALRGQIVRGELKPGDSLPSEVDLMKQFGVSRPTLREAFRILEAESLISIRRGARGGGLVTTPDISVAARYIGLLLQMDGTTIGEVYEARTLIEPVAAGLLAKRRTQRDLADLRQCIEKLHELYEESGKDKPVDVRVLADASYEFHDLILERAGNRALLVQGRLLREVVKMHLLMTVERAQARRQMAEPFRKSLRSYSRLVDLVEERDIEGAEAHWREHMEGAGKFLLGGKIASKAVVDLFRPQR